MTKIICATCGIPKDPEEFNWRNKALGIRHPTCRECHKPFRKNWYHENKEEHLAHVKERKERVRNEAREYVWNTFQLIPVSAVANLIPLSWSFTIATANVPK